MIAQSIFYYQQTYYSTCKKYYSVYVFFHYSAYVYLTSYLLFVIIYTALNWLFHFYKYKKNQTKEGALWI